LRLAVWAEAGVAHMPPASPAVPDAPATPARAAILAVPLRSCLRLTAVSVMFFGIVVPFG
jgi:hypothetical protein